MQIEVREMPLVKVRPYAVFVRTSANDRCVSSVEPPPTVEALLSPLPLGALPPLLVVVVVVVVVVVLPPFSCFFVSGTAATLLLFLRRSLRLLLRPSFCFRRRFL